MSTLGEAGDFAPVRAHLAELVAGSRPGTRLPAERMLAHRIGIGRAHLRRALRDLEEAGRITIRAQSGSYVR
jgi:DNA-binding FadR family transcriptional regulator